MSDDSQPDIASIIQALAAADEGAGDGKGLSGNQPDVHYRDRLRSLAARKAEFDAFMHARVEELRSLLRRFHPLDVMAAVSWRNTSRLKDLNAYRQGAPDERTSDAYTEYVALLCLTMPFDTFRISRDNPLTAPTAERIQNLVRKLFALAPHAILIEEIKKGQPQTLPQALLSELRCEVMIRALAERYPAVPQNQQEMLQDLFAHIENDLLQVVGFHIQDALKLISAIRDIWLAKEDELRTQTAAWHRGLKEAVKRLRQKRKEAAGSNAGDLNRLSKMRPSMSRAEIDQSATDRFVAQLGKQLQFTADDLVAKTGIEKQAHPVNARFCA